MKIQSVLIFELLCTSLLCTPLFCPARSSAQAAPAAPLRYAFSASFPTQFSPKDGDGFRAQGIAVDDGGQVYLTAKGEGIVEFDAQRKYHFSFGYPAPEEERDGVDQNGNPETGDDMPLSQRAYLPAQTASPSLSCLMPKRCPSQATSSTPVLSPSMQRGRFQPLTS